MVNFLKVDANNTTYVMRIYFGKGCYKGGIAASQNGVFIENVILASNLREVDLPSGLCVRKSPIGRGNSGRRRSGTLEKMGGDPVAKGQDLIPVAKYSG